jgi:hypothetical protein
MPIPIHQIKPGDVVFIERPMDAKGQDGGSLSNYEAGEYLVLRVGAASIEVVKPTSGYELHRSKTFTLVGNNRWDVGVCEPGLKAINDALDVIADFAVESRSPKKQWIQSVYDEAMVMGKRLKRIREERWATAAPKAVVAGMTFHDVLQSTHDDGIIIDGHFYPCPPDHLPTFEIAFCDCGEC